MVESRQHLPTPVAHDPKTDALATPDETEPQTPEDPSW